MTKLLSMTMLMKPILTPNPHNGHNPHYALQHQQYFQIPHLFPSMYFTLAYIVKICDSCINILCTVALSEARATLPESTLTGQNGPFTQLSPCLTRNGCIIKTTLIFTKQVIAGSFPLVSQDQKPDPKPG